VNDKLHFEVDRGTLPGIAVEWVGGLEVRQNGAGAPAAVHGAGGTLLGGHFGVGQILCTVQRHGTFHSSIDLNMGKSRD
jgi:hypothetical protein